MSQAPSATSGLSGSTRDVRVDFFRGIAMLIIYMAHMPGNRWGEFIPARFGPSDATEWFVFCAGFASAIAFGGVFVRRGMAMGTARILHRCWQIYWAHIGLFFAVAALCVAGNFYLGTEKDYVGNLNLYPFVNDDTMRGIFHLMTLTYVPNYFDILPMYMVILLMVPIVMALARIHAAFAGAFCVAVYVATWVWGLNFPAEWWTERQWFFNPLGWQVVFFLGFATSAGWIRPPRPNWWLTGAAILFVLAILPFKYAPIWENVGWINAFSYELLPGFEKTDFGLLRLLHFMCLAYLAYAAFLGREHWLAMDWAKPIVKVGQNSLPVFLSSMWLSWAGGMVLDLIGRDDLTWALVNLGGIAILIGVAYGAAWFRAQPWRKKRDHAAASAADSQAEPRYVSSRPTFGDRRLAPGE